MMQFNMYHHYTVDEHLIRVDRQARRDRARRGRRGPSAGERDLSRPQGPHRPLRRALPARHRQGPAGGSLARRRARRPPARAALRADAGADRHGRLAGRAPPADEHHRHLARPQRPQDHRRLRRRGAEPRADEDAPHPHHRRHQGGRPGRVERLEGPAPADALLRDRAGADRRPQPGQPRPPRRRGQGGARRGARRLAGEGARAPISTATTRPTGCGSTSPARSPMPTSSAPPRPTASGSPPASAPALSRASPRSPCSRPTIPRLLSIIAGACTIAGGNIVDAQIFTTSDGRALDSISISREFDDEADEERRARKVGDLIEQALSGRAAHARARRQEAAAEAAPEGVHAGDRASSSTTPRRTSSPSSRRPASTGPASSTTSPAPSPTSTSTSPRRTSRPSASGWSTSST